MTSWQHSLRGLGFHQQTSRNHRQAQSGSIEASILQVQQYVVKRDAERSMQVVETAFE